MSASQRLIPNDVVPCQRLYTAIARRLVNHRTALVSQMRGLMLDRGIPIALSIGRARRAIPEILEDRTNELSATSREIIGYLFDFMGQIDARITAFDRRIDTDFKSNADCRWIARICGVGPKTATAVVGVVGGGREFKNGRHLAAWMGLVPRQHSIGNKRLLMWISKRGDRHLQTLLIHGARSAQRSERRTRSVSESTGCPSDAA